VEVKNKIEVLGKPYKTRDSEFSEGHKVGRKEVRR